MNSSKKRYVETLGLGKASFELDILGELRSFVGFQGSDQELKKKCIDATPEIDLEWKKRKIDPSNTNQVDSFYKDIDLYCFELIGFELNCPEGRMDLLQDFVKFLSERKLKKGLDFGSGVGTLGIYLNKNGFVCDFADISETNLAFVGARLERRGISGAKRIQLSDDVVLETYDFVFVCDVFEHVVDPVGLLRKLTKKVRPGGVLIFNLLYDNNDDTPHIMKDPKSFRINLRRSGLKKVGNLGEFKIYERVQRWPLLNGVLDLLDGLFWNLRGFLIGLTQPLRNRLKSS